MEFSSLVHVESFHPSPSVEGILAMMTGAFSTLHVLGAASFAPMARYSGFAATRSSAVGPRMVYNVDAAMAVDGQSSMYNFADGAGTVAARVGQRWGNGGYYDRGMGRGGV
jgi:hypothetical protein